MAEKDTIVPSIRNLPWIETGTVRIGKTIPDVYRLARKPDGELVLQGAYFWQEGNINGHEWRDIPTVPHTKQEG